MKTFFKLIISSILPLGLFSIQNSEAQVFAEYQSARSIGKGNTEITGHYTSVSISYDGESAKVFNVFGIQSGLGFGENFEIRVRYDRLNFDGEGSGGYNLISFGPKFSTKNGRFAALLPFASTSSDGESLWQVNPTLMFSLPITEKFEVTLTPKYVITLEEGSKIDDGLMAFNLGFGIEFLEKWMARPEGGLMFMPGEDGNFFNFGLGVSRKLGKNEE